MNGVRALIFDTFGTLVDWWGGMIAHLSSWGDARGIRADWPTLVDAWRMDYPPSLDRVRRGERAWANLDVLHASHSNVWHQSSAFPRKMTRTTGWLLNSTTPSSGRPTRRCPLGSWPRCWVGQRRLASAISTWWNSTTGSLSTSPTPKARSAHNTTPS